MKFLNDAPWPPHLLQSEAQRRLPNAPWRPARSAPCAPYSRSWRSAARRPPTQCAHGNNEPCFFLRFCRGLCHLSAESSDLRPPQAPLAEEGEERILLRAVTIDVPSGVEYTPSRGIQSARARRGGQQGANRLRRRLAQNEEVNPTAAAGHDDGTPPVPPPAPPLPPLPPAPRWWLAAVTEQYLVHLKPPISRAAREALDRALTGPPYPSPSPSLETPSGGTPLYVLSQNESGGSIAPPPPPEGAVAGYVPMSSYLVVGDPAAMVG